MSQWLRTTVTSAHAQSTLSGSSDVFAQAVSKPPIGVNDPRLAEDRDRASMLFRSLEEAFGTAASAEQSHDKAGAKAAIERVAARLDAVAGVASQLLDHCPR
jgi:hypothetical protein